MCAYYVPGAILRALNIFSYLILTTHYKICVISLISMLQIKWQTGKLNNLLKTSMIKWQNWGLCLQPVSSSPHPKK